MASLEEALFAKLSTTSAITAIVGTRIYPVKMPDDPTFPAITYQRISTVRPQVIGGKVDLANSLFQFDMWVRESQGKLTVLNLEKAVYNTVEGFRGIVSGVDIRSILQVNYLDGYEAEVELFRALHTYRIFYIEP